MNRNDGGPAFPVIVSLEPSDYGKTSVMACGGMTLRDYFAAKAMAGIFAHHGNRGDYATVAEYAYSIADAMLARRDA